MLTFDEPSHTYRWNGKVVPGVTSILAPLSDYASVPPQILEEASRFGRLVHQCTQFMDEGHKLTNISAALVPYLDAWAQFSIDHSVVWDQLEHQAYSEHFGYAGTPDRYGLVDDEQTVVDIKTTAAWMPSFGPQLAAYEQLVEPNKPRGLVRRMAVRLQADGTYITRYYTSPMDWSTFVSCLTLNRFCQQHQFTPSWSKK